MARRTYYDILGVPMGASTDHIKASYRLLTRKTLITDVAYRALTTPESRREYNAWLLEDSKPTTHPHNESAGDDGWGKRGRERCSCGAILKLDDEWNCQTCWATMEYYIVFDAFGGYIIHDSQIPLVTEPDGKTYFQAPQGSLFGPFPKKEAEDVLAEKNKLRKNV